MKLVMISGDRALAEGKRGAFYNTLEEFHKHWDRIDIICPFASSSSPVFNPFDNIFIHPSPWPLLLQPLWIIKKGKALYREIGYDLITVHEFPPFYNGLGATWLWEKIGVPYLLEIHHVPGYPRAAGLKEWIYEKLFRLGIRFDVARAKAVRVVNNYQIPDYLISAGVPKEKIFLIPSFYIDLETFKPLNLRTFELLNFSKRYDLIFVGRLVKNKGIELFLKTVAELAGKALIVGDGPLRESLKLKVKNLGLEDKVTFHGWAKDASEIATLINQAKLLVVTSYNEGGPRVLLEALACGVPVVTTDVGIARDLQAAGVIDEPCQWDAHDIAATSRQLLEDAQKYEKLSNLGLEYVKQFEYKAAIKQYADKLKSLHG